MRWSLPYRAIPRRCRRLPSFRGPPVHWVIPCRWTQNDKVSDDEEGAGKQDCDASPAAVPPRKLVFGEITTGASNDIEQATRAGAGDGYPLRHDVRNSIWSRWRPSTTSIWAVTPRLACSADTQKEIDKRVVETVKAQHDKARRLLEEHRDKLDKLAGYLYEKETITGSEFMAILNGKEGHTV